MKEEDLDHLLHTVLVPSQPPNRSQWRKLELALKFINNSKKSVSQNKLATENRTNYKLEDLQFGA